MSIDKVAARLKEPNGAEKLMESAEAAFPAAWELFLSGDAQAAAFLCRCAKRKVFFERINAELGGERAPLYAALASEEPKMRKNAARLAGALKCAGDAPKLIAALNAETTRFVRPSLLLALGAVGGEAAEKYLAGCTVAPAADESELRHVREEEDALLTAKKSFIKTEAREFTGLGGQHEIELTVPEHLADSLVYELKKLNIKPKRITADSVVVMTGDLAALYDCRSFFEPLIVIARGLPADESAAKAIRVPFIKLLSESLSGEPPYSYRIELRGEADRAGLTRAIAKSLDGDRLVNAPGNYSAELRLRLTGDGRLDAYARFSTVEDRRFPYRVETLPASIHPVTAAALLLYAREYLEPGARVLDPCCGSGTMLFERERLTDCASLTGVDIAHRAIEIARKNAIAGESRAKFVTNDSLRFTAERPYDELIANLPFGNRVGNHKANELFYAGLLDRLPHWVKKGGVAVLYTMEFTLLKKLLRDRPALRLVTEITTNAGGLLPGVFIVKV